MYATSHRVVGRDGAEGINSFLHAHTDGFVWPEDPWNLPEVNPGDLVWTSTQVPPGGNRVRSYLDVLAANGTTREALDDALSSLWLELVADEASGAMELPNPLLYRFGDVFIRLGLDFVLIAGRPLEMAQLRQALNGALDEWFRNR